MLSLLKAAGVATVTIALGLSAAPVADASWPGRNGAIAFVGADFPENRGEPFRNGIWIGRPNGEPRRLTDEPGDQAPAFSPDGQLIASSRATGPVDARGVYTRRAIFLLRPDGSGLARLTDGASQDLDPSFTADGRRVLFARSPVGGRNGDDIYSVAVDGSGLRRLTAGRATDRRPVASPNGRIVAFDRRAGGRTRVFTMRPNGARIRNATRRLPHRDDALDPDFRPDGRRIAYTRIHDGRAHLFLIRPDGRRPRPLPARRRCSGCPVYFAPAFAPNGRSVLAVAARSFRYFLVSVPLRRPRAVHPLPSGFGGRQDAIEPAWQPLP